MASEPNEQYLSIVRKKPSQPQKPSNSERVYGIGGFPYTEGFVTPRLPRLPQLKTYSRKRYTFNNLRSVTTAGRIPDERSSPTKTLSHIRSPPSRGDQHLGASTAKIQLDETSVDHPLRIALLTDSHQRANATLTTKPDAKIRKELREVSKECTPVAKRMDKRRQQSRDKVVARLAGSRKHANAHLPPKPNATVHKELREVPKDNRPIAKRIDGRRQQSLAQAETAVTTRRSAAQEVLVRHDQAGEKWAPECQTADETLQSHPQDDGQDSPHSEESLNLEEAIKKARQAQHVDNSRSKYHMPAMVWGGKTLIPTLVEFEDAGLEPAASPAGEEGIKKPPQQSQSLLGIEPKDKLSSMKLPRHGSLPIIPVEKLEDQDSAESNGCNQEDGEDQLDDLENEILHLGENVNDRSDDQSSSQLVFDSRNPKRRRSSPDRDSPDIYDLEMDIDEENDEDFEQSPKKPRRTSRTNQRVEAHDVLLMELKGRRASKESQSRASAKEKIKSRKPRQSKKTRRSLPIDELVLVSERFNGSDAEDDRETPIELPEDPISQLSLSLEKFHPKTNGQKYFRRLDINLKSGKEFETINISEFRMPKKQVVTAEAQRQRTLTHSDGFEGQEAQLTGRLMPIRKQSRHKRFFHKLTIRLGELTLVAERPYDQEHQPPSEQNHSRRSRATKERRRNQIIAPITLENEQHDGGDRMIVDDEEELPVDGDDVPQQPVGQERTTPQISASENSPSQALTRSSPLKQKEERMRKVTCKDETTVKAQPSQTASTQSGGPFNRYKSNEVSVSEQRKMISAPKVVVTPRKKEIAVDYQLMMVSIPRSSMEGTDSEDESGEESYEEDGSESEQDSENSEEERNDTLEVDTEEESGSQLENAAEAEEDMEMIDQQHSVPAPKAAELRGPRPPRTIEVQIPPTQVQVPTLHKEDALNPIINIRAEHLREVVSTPLKPTPRRRSARLPDNQALKPDELLLRSIDGMIVDKLETKDRSEPARRKAKNDDDDSWRPRKPITSSIAMEVGDDEIVDTPSPVCDHITSSNKRRDASRRLSLIACQAPRLVASRLSSPQQELPLLSNHDSQGSVELGETQRLFRYSPHSCIPETQIQTLEQELEEEQESDIPRSQRTFVPESSYFERASQDLQQLFRKPNLVRSKSMFASMHTPLREDEGEFGIMAGGITMTAALQHTISLIRSSGHVPTLMSSSGKERNLKSLTRQASIELGTLPSGRKRLVSLPFHPPFKKD